MDKPRPKIKEPFVTSGMNLPKKIACTGDINVLNDYLADSPKDTKGNPLSAKAEQHLRDRIETMQYVNDLATGFAHKKVRPLSAKKTKNGFVLEGIHQPDRQETGHCCWTMPAKLMLQSRGIDIDQETLRCCKPEVDLNEEQLDNLDDDQIREFTQNTNGNIRNLSGLMRKLIPNSAMVQVTYSVPYNLKSSDSSKRDNEIAMRDFKNRVTEMIGKHGSPIAMLRNGHYRTIVGIDGDDVIVKDSLSAIHGPDSDYRVSIKSMFSTPSDQTELTYMVDLTVDDPERLPAELEELSDVANVGKGVDKGKLTLDVPMNGLSKANGDNILFDTEPHHGSKCSLLYEQKIGDRQDGTSITVGEQWILPEKLTENVITVERREDIAEEEDREYTNEEIIANGGENYGIKTSEELMTNNALSDLASREDEYLQELPESGYKRMVEMANEARQNMRSFAVTKRLGWTIEDFNRNAECMKLMVLSKAMETERALNGGKPGELEKVFDNGKGLDTLLTGAKYAKLFTECPAPSNMERSDIERFILNDEAGKIARNAFINEDGKNNSLSAGTRRERAAVITNATDPAHEIERLNILYKKLQNADPALLKSSDEFRTMKKNLEKVIELRKKRCDIGDAKLEINVKGKDVMALSKAYKALHDSAEAYMRIKNPALLKSGSITEKRYETASAVFDLSAEFKKDYQKAAAGIVRDNPLLNNPSLSESLSRSSDKPSLK